MGGAADRQGWPGRIHVITVFVEDLDLAKPFYREVSGLSIAFEDGDSAVFDFGNTVVKPAEDQRRT